MGEQTRAPRSRVRKPRAPKIGESVVWVALSRVEGARLSRDESGRWWDETRAVPAAVAECLTLLVGAGLVRLGPPAGRIRDRAAQLTDAGRKRLVELADEHLVSAPRR